MSHSGAASASSLAPSCKLEIEHQKHTSLPCPEDPTSSLLVAVELSFDELADVLSVGRIEASDCSAVLAIAASDVG